MLILRDIMTPDPVTLTPQTSIRDAVEFLRSRGISGAPVVSGTRVVGVVSNSDFVDFTSDQGVTQTDGLAKNAHSDDMAWLASDSVPTMGDWFRAGGYRTYYKGKWHCINHNCGWENTNC